MLNIILLGGQLIDQTTHQGVILPNKTWESHSYNGPTATIEYKLRVVCDTYYYGQTCTKLCKPRNDKFGHYKCDKRGNKICRAGWRGELCDIGKITLVNGEVSLLTLRYIRFLFLPIDQIS